MSMGVFVVTLLPFAIGCFSGFVFILCGDTRSARRECEELREENQMLRAELAKRGAA